MKIEGVKLIGNESAWFKLNPRIRTIIKNKGLARLSHIRKLISVDASLPMPEIRIEPCGWIYPKEYGGMIYARTNLITTKTGKSFGAIVSAATLIAVEDDRVLRGLLCHEFAHCFWWFTIVLQEAKEDERYITETPKPFDYKADSKVMVQPKEWFGKWDCKHFIYGNEPILDKSTIKFSNCWIKAGLPTKILSSNNLSFVFAGEVEIEDEIIEHIQQLRVENHP